jgi:3-hydroxyisobutyrate dehydrogenase-like beta-hydroxyacid dehydrogenase
VHYLDATISGSSAQLLQHDVLVMVGGDVAILQRCHDLLACFSREAVHVGRCGDGARMKLVTNLVLGLNRAALAEGLVFARQLGLDPAQALGVMRRSMAWSRIMDTKGDKMVNEDFAPQAKLAQHLKDVRLMIGATDLPLPLTETHRKLLEKAVALGYGDLDNSAVIKSIE